MNSLNQLKLPLGQGVEIVESHPCGLVAFNKPTRVMSHPNDERDQKYALLDTEYLLDEECYVWHDGGGEERRFYLLNRLDSPTSGVILGATDLGVAEKVRRLFKERKVAKKYHALVWGAPQKLSGGWRDILDKKYVGGRVRVREGLKYTAITAYKRIKRNRANAVVSLIELEPKTGRTHQLRVQCAKHGFPILGDKTYGDFSKNRMLRKQVSSKRLYLHASELSLSFEYEGEPVDFRAEVAIPEVFEEVLGLRTL